jgi:hypothetical protein
VRGILVGNSDGNTLLRGPAVDGIPFRRLNLWEDINLNLKEIRLEGVKYFRLKENIDKRLVM